MKVLKFGGSSLNSSEKINQVIDIITKNEEQCTVVVSAFHHVTDQLIEVATLASTNNNQYLIKLEELTARHIKVINSLNFEATKLDEIREYVSNNLKQLANILHGIYLLNDITPKIRAKILSFGESMSAYIVSNLLKNGKLIDARDVIQTSDDYEHAKVDFKRTNKLISEKITDKSATYVVPGFIARNSAGETTLLGRGGSDYTAAILAAATDASILEIWTDVDGFMTADPRKVRKAIAVEKLSYAEAMELSHFGAKVLYTPTVQPVYKKNIPILIKNTFNPEVQGTLISHDKDDSGKLIKGISSIDNVDLITIMGPGMVGAEGTSGRVFTALAKNNINIILITQASSEYSITFAIRPADSKKALNTIEKEFGIEIKREEVSVRVEKELSVIAIVGEQMKNTPGISANLFRSLGRNGISVIATAQGSSELNISVVIKNEQLKKALNVIHEGFFLSHFKELHIFITGIGTVGSKLLEQISQQKEKLLKEQKLNINVVGISNSRKMIINPLGINLDSYKNDLEECGEVASLDKMIEEIHKLNLRNGVFIDCTANEKVAGYYKNILESYVSVVTANKIACSSDYKLYKDLKQLALNKGVKFMFETNVGAGLPIINTINDLLKSGDKIISLEAVLSGTLNFIFNTLSEDIPLSKAIMLAKEKGFSEPDPRIDLSGIDVVRKILILAREAGYELEQSDVQTKTFLPDDCFKGSIDDFWNKVKEFDEPFEKERKRLVSEDKKWRFVASLVNGKASVELKEVDVNHPSYNLEGSNNIILITTERYHEEPMIIKGYGAGADVTAAGVFADFIRVANV